MLPCACERDSSRQVERLFDTSIVTYLVYALLDNRRNTDCEHMRLLYVYATFIDGQDFDCAITTPSPEKATQQLCVLRTGTALSRVPFLVALLSHKRLCLSRLFSRPLSENFKRFLTFSLASLIHFFAPACQVKIFGTSCAEVFPQN